MDASQDALTIYTIGHGNVTDQELLNLLANYEIKVLLDVRSVPYSQYTHQFNRELFSQTLGTAGIDYRFAGEYLGGRPKDPTCYKNGELPEGKANYLGLVDYREVAKRAWYLKAIDRLLMIATEQRTVLMCSEEDPQRCHRHHLVAQTLLEKGIAVVHLRANGRSELAKINQEPQQLSLI